MKLSDATNFTILAFATTIRSEEARIEDMRRKNLPEQYILEEEEGLDELRKAFDLIKGLLFAELRSREKKEERDDPFPSPRHHIFEYTNPTGPNGERFTFARRTDLVTENPVGSRGWYPTRAACVTALWADHDTLVAEEELDRVS